MDTKKSCLNCPERSVEPNCHMTCAAYLARSRACAEANERRAEAHEGHVIDVRRCNALRKGRKKR